MSVSTVIVFVFVFLIVDFGVSTFCCFGDADEGPFFGFDFNDTLPSCDTFFFVTVLAPATATVMFIVVVVVVVAFAFAFEGVGV